jgi:hypothetical protein
VALTVDFHNNEQEEDYAFVRVVREEVDVLHAEVLHMCLKLGQRVVAFVDSLVPVLEQEVVPSSHLNLFELALVAVLVFESEVEVVAADAAVVVDEQRNNFVDLAEVVEVVGNNLVVEQLDVDCMCFENNLVLILEDLVDKNLELEEVGKEHYDSLGIEEHYKCLEVEAVLPCVARLVLCC